MPKPDSSVVYIISEGYRWNSSLFVFLNFLPIHKTHAEIKKKIEETNEIKPAQHKYDSKPKRSNTIFRFAILLLLLLQLSSSSFSVIIIAVAVVFHHARAMSIEDIFQRHISSTCAYGKNWNHFTFQKKKYIQITILLEKRQGKIEYAYTVHKHTKKKRNRDKMNASFPSGNVCCIELVVNYENRQFFLSSTISVKTSRYIDLKRNSHIIGFKQGSMYEYGIIYTVVWYPCIGIISSFYYI